MTNKDILNKLKDKFPSSLDEAKSFLTESINTNDGNAQLLTAYCNDVLGNELVAQGHYEKAMELGFIESELETWYVSYGSTLRWNKKLDKSLEILEEGLSKFKDSKDMPVMIAMTLFDQKKINKETLLEEVNKNNPKRVDWVIESLNL